MPDVSKNIWEKMEKSIDEGSTCCPHCHTRVEKIMARTIWPVFSILRKRCVGSYCITCKQQVWNCVSCSEIKKIGF